MSFQFQCPQCARLLEAEPSQVGQQCACPFCNTVLLIPAPVAGPAEASSPGCAPADARPAPTAPAASPPGADVPFPKVGPAVGQTPPPSVQPAGPPAPAAKEPAVLHIPCPQCRKILETPEEMLDQDVMCPHCQAQFRLRRRDSQEYQRKRKQMRELRERKASNAWLNAAIAIAVLVAIFLLFLIFATPSD